MNISPAALLTVPLFKTSAQAHLPLEAFLICPATGDAGLPYALTGVVTSPQMTDAAVPPLVFLGSYGVFR